MNELIQKYAAASVGFDDSTIAAPEGPTLAAHALQVVHMPLPPVCAELGERVRADVESHPQREKITAVCAYGAWNRGRLPTDVKDRLALRERGAMTEDSKFLLDVSPCLTAGAADSSAAAHVVMRALCPNLRDVMPLPGHYALGVPDSAKERALFVPAPPRLPVALHVLAGEADLEWVARPMGDGALDLEWQQVMSSTTPPWFAKPPCRQTAFSPSVGEALAAAGVKRGRIHVRPGDVVVLPAGAPFWVKPTDGELTVLHTVTLVAMALAVREKGGIEESVAIWRGLFRIGGVCDPDLYTGPVEKTAFRTCGFFLDLEKPESTGGPHHALDSSLMFDLPWGTLAQKRISNGEQYLLFWTSFLLKHVAALQSLAPDLWRAEEYEKNVRKHLDTWLAYARDPQTNVKPDTWAKTSTVRSVSETLWKLLETFMSRLTHWQTWAPRFEAAVARLSQSKFGSKTPQEAQRRSVLRAAKEIQKLNGWAKVYQYDKYVALPDICAEAEQLLDTPGLRPLDALSDSDDDAPARQPPNPQQYVATRLAGLSDFREARLPEDQVAALEVMLKADPVVADYPAIDRAYHALLVQHDPTRGPYEEPAWAHATAGKGKAPKKKARAAPSRSADEDDEDGEDIGEAGDGDEDEVPLGTVVRPLIKRKWNGNASLTDKERCAGCKETMVLFAGRYCEECAMSDMTEMLERSLGRALTVLKKRAEPEAFHQFCERVSVLRHKGEEADEILQDAEEEDKTKVRVFKALLDEFAALERDFEAQHRIVLAKVEDNHDIEVYEENEDDEDEDDASGSGDASDDEDEDEESEGAFHQLPSDYDEDEDFEERESRRKKSKGQAATAVTGKPDPQAALALDLLRFRHQVGLFIEPQREMEELCLGGKPEQLTGARAILDKLRAPATGPWGVEACKIKPGPDAFKNKANATQFCESLGWFATREQAEKALTMQMVLYAHLADVCEFRVVEKKRGGQ